MKINLKKVLLTGTALVAVGAFGAQAQAANLEAAAAAATPTDLSAVVAADSIVNAVDTNSPDGAYVDVDGDLAATSINYDFTGLLAIVDSGATAEALTVSTFMDVASGTTTTLLFGSTVADGSGTDSVADSTLAIGTTLGEAGATTLTRGGTLAVLGAANEGGGAGILTVDGNTLMTTITVTAGAGGAAEDGTSVTATFGDASADTFDVTGMSVIGGAANGAADQVGGAADVTVNGTATIGAGNLAVTGGAAAAGTGGGVAGGASSLLFADDVSLTGNITVTGGADHNSAGGAGGDASLTFQGDVSSTGTLTVATGTQNAAGGGLSGDGAVNFQGDVTFASITLTDNGDGAATMLLDGDAAQAVTGAIAGSGAITVDNDAGVTFNNAVTSTSILVAGTAVNSAATFKAAVTSAVTLGDGANTDTNTVTFNGATAGYTVTGTVNGTAGDTDNVVVTGGNTIATTAAWGGVSALDSVSLTTSGTTLALGANLSATDVTLASGTVLQTTAAATITGDINGAGTLNVDDDTTVAGNIGDSTALTSVTVAEGKVLTVDATAADVEVNATTILLEDATSDGTDASIALTAAGNTITFGNAITVGVDGEGAITGGGGDSGTVVFGADVGTSTKALGALTLTSNAAAIAIETEDDLYIDAIQIGQNDSITFLGDGVSQVVSGTIDANGAANRGAIVVGDATTATNVTFNGLIGGTNDLAGLTVNANATATFAAAGNNGFDGAFNNNGTTIINSGATLDVAGGYTGDATAGVFKLGAKRTAGTTTIGILDITAGGAPDFSNDTLTFFVESGSQPLAAETIASVIGGNTGALTTFGTINDTSYLYSFTPVANGNDLDVTIALAQTLAASTTTTNNNTVADVLITDLAASVNAEINLAQANAGAATSQAAFNEVLESVQPTVDGGASGAAFEVAATTLDLTGDRLAALRSGETPTGMAAGNAASGMRWWVQGFGQAANQDVRDGIDGYDSRTYGVAVGLDTQNIADNGTIGVAFSYADTNVDSDNANTTDTEVDSYQLTLYGDYDLDSRTYLNGMVAYAWNNVDLTRHDVGGAGGPDANADYDANQFSARLELGRDYQYEGATLTPNAMAHWSHYDADGYTETGAGGLNQTVTQDELNVFELGVGVDASWNVANADGSHVVPVLSAGVRHDLVGDEVAATNQWAGGGGTFAVRGADPAQTALDLGAAVTYYSTDNWELTADYNFTYKADYDAHAGFLRAAYKF